MSIDVIHDLDSNNKLTPCDDNLELTSLLRETMLPKASINSNLDIAEEKEGKDENSKPPNNSNGMLLSGSMEVDNVISFSDETVSEVSSETKNQKEILKSTSVSCYISFHLKTVTLCTVVPFLTLQ